MKGSRIVIVSMRTSQSTTIGGCCTVNRQKASTGFCLTMWWWQNRWICICFAAHELMQTRNQATRANGQVKPSGGGYCAWRRRLMATGPASRAYSPGGCHITDPYITQVKLGTRISWVHVEALAAHNWFLVHFHTLTPAHTRSTECMYQCSTPRVAKVPCLPLSSLSWKPKALTSSTSSTETIGSTALTRAATSSSLLALTGYFQHHFRVRPLRI